MIESLAIENLGVIEKAAVDLGAGFTVVTGETGAGKTLFITALNLLTGARAETGMVRLGAKRATVEGIFHTGQLPAIAERVRDAGGDLDDDELVITRVLPAQGRARATAGGRTVPATVLSEIGADLISMHGQSEQLTLKSATKQRELLDSFGAKSIVPLFDTYRAAYVHHRELRARHEQLLADQEQRTQRIAYLEKALADIEAVRPVLGEDEELKNLTIKLSAAEDLRNTVELASAMLVGNDGVDETAQAVDLLNRAASELGHAAQMDESVKVYAETLTTAALTVSDVAAELATYIDGFADLEDVSLEELQERRAALSSLDAYGADLQAVLEFETAAGSELLTLESDSADLARMDEKVSAAHAELLNTAQALSEARSAVAKEFSTLVTAELAALSMPNAQVICHVEPAEPGPNGADTIQLLFAANSGHAPSDISKVASGGELSRAMLAIEVVMAARTTFPTFIFDEVDSGVGGRAATEIGHRLAKLAKHSQVIVVTHLAQVAAWADRHIIIHKDDHGTGAVSGVIELDADQRRNELARMLGGLAESDSAQAHADELLDVAARKKSEFLAGS